MRILEVKNNLVKISFNADEHLVLSGFVIIEDENMPYVAQIMNLKADETGNYAIVKLIFTFNSDGIVSNYDGSIPSLNAVVTNLPSPELLDILPLNNPLKMGVLAQQQFLLNLDQTLLKKDLLICSDKNENTDILINNIIKQLQRNNQKVIVCDIDDSITHEDKFIFTEDFKLPLNYDTINYIWENELDDVDATSKAVIQDIFLEVQEYAKTAPHKYIPFNTFIEVVNSQYAETSLPELVLLKNKLLKYEENNIFANHYSEFESLQEFLGKNISTVIDISTAINPKLQKQVIEYIYEVMHSMRETIISLVPVTNSNSDKKLLKLFYAPGNVFTTVISSHEYKYISELKQIARNIIMFQPQTVQHDFASYNTYLNKLNPDEFIVYGELTQNIPLIVQSMQLEALDTLERKLQEEKQLAEEKQKEFEKAQAELEAASRPIMTPPDSEHITVDFEDEPDDIADNALEAVNENSSDDLQIIEEEPHGEELSEESLEPIEEEESAPVETYDDIVINEEQEDGTTIEEEILPPSKDTPEDISEEPATSEIQEEITIEEPLPEDPYQNIFDNQNPFPKESQEQDTITDTAAEDVDKYIIYNDQKDEIPSIDDLIEMEKQEQLAQESTADTTEHNIPDETSSLSEIPEVTYPKEESEEEDNSVIIEELPSAEEPADEQEQPLFNEQPENPPSASDEDAENLQEQPVVIEEEEENHSFATLEELAPAENENKYVGLNDFEDAAAKTEDTLTEDDLNFIDELNLDAPAEEQTAEQSAEDNEVAADEIETLPPTNNNVQDTAETADSEFDDTPIVPIYPAEDNIDIVEGNAETFEQGDKVSHPKYGIGIVEKMIKYGNKTLCSINFENVGRRLLDPAISEITKA